MGTSHGLAQAIVAQTLGGADAAICELTAVAGVAEITPARWRGVSLSAVTFSIVFFMPQILYFVLINKYSTWRYCFLLCGLWNLLGLVGLFFCYHSPPRQNIDNLSTKDILSRIDYGRRSDHTSMDFYSILGFFPIVLENVFNTSDITIGVRALCYPWTILGGACILSTVMSYSKGHVREMFFIRSAIMADFTGALPPPGIPEYQHWLKFKDQYGKLRVHYRPRPNHHRDPRQSHRIRAHGKASKQVLRPTGPEVCKRDLSVPMSVFEGWDGASRDIIAGLLYSPAHRLYRGYAYQHIGSKTAAANYHTPQKIAVGRCLWRLQRDGGANLVQHLHTEAAEMILDVVYGCAIEPHGKDPMVETVDRAMEQFSAAAIPGKRAVDTLPFLQSMPEWLPGASFKRTAREWRQTLMEVVNAPYEFTKSQMSQGGPNTTSFAAESIEESRREKVLGKEEEHAIKWSAAPMYTGGADTSVSTMVAFFLAMSMFPDVQRKAQEEIDRVVGDSRLSDHHVCAATHLPKCDGARVIDNITARHKPL